MVNGCASLQRSPVPGVRNSVNDIDLPPIEVTEVLDALKCELGRAFYMAAGEFPDSRRFKLQKGNAFFTGKTQTVVSNKGSISAVFPLTSIAGSIITPSGAISQSSTGAYDTQIVFSVDPDISKKSEPEWITCGGKPTNTTADEDNYIEKSIIGALRGVTGARTGQPNFGFTRLTVNTSFVVVRKIEGGITTKVVFAPPPTIDSTAPGVAADATSTRTYTLRISLPMKTPEPPDSRKILFCRHGKPFASLCVEEPYTKKRFDELSEIVGKLRGATLDVTDNFDDTSPEDLLDQFVPIGGAEDF